ncbi:Pkinase domain-containing protein/GUB_WAK_bind domain-containing protein [Cephalotus follicularis]|uniref:Pkinase domain-containing protein/GUB_WAK_bind domain-containing protein n=1 Tax=Cephalotus follicularis TaxID=3775 RepID=A0A1Q3BHX7_CEPFO|nr:Pkinase domain-containing protein/GUB_WAK_bind domain-containing protein [Cephalotus follicularis]
MLLFLFWSLLLTKLVELATSASCKPHGLDIRFPFWLSDQQPDNHGYPGFELSCNGKDTVLMLPYSVKFFVKNIDYKAQQIHVYDPDSCLPRQLIKLNISASAFSFIKESTTKVTLFNCSSSLQSVSGELPCLSSPGHKVYVSTSYGYAVGHSLLSCREIGNLSVPPDVTSVYQTDLRLNWYKPMCSNCEAEGKGCRLKINSTLNETECFSIERQHTGASIKIVVTGVVLGAFLLALVSFGVYYYVFRFKKETESELKMKRFLEDYHALKPTRYSYADIKRMTNQFEEKLGQGGYGTVFKGRLSSDVLVAVKVLDNFKGDGEEFINEVGSMGRIHHRNVARLVGFCADGYKRALVYEYLPNGSLEKFVFADEGENCCSLGYEKLQDIALGIARGIEYLHQGCDQQILHFDIKPHNILLDHKFNPKISDFGLAKLCSKDKSSVSMTTARGTMGYIAPEVLSRNFGNVSHKSDVYSFGMLLLQMVGGREFVDVTVESTSQDYFTELRYNHLYKGEGLGIGADDRLYNANIARKLTIVGLWCIQWHPAERPSMKVVVQMLEGEGDNLPMPPHPYASAV